MNGIQSGWGLLGKTVAAAALAPFFVCALALSGRGEGAPSTILDYYLALPDAYFQCEMEAKITTQEKMKQIVRKNVKNGYLLAKSEGYPMEVALFVDATGKERVIAVNISCGEGCMCNKFALLRYLGPGKWKNVTADLMPPDGEIDAAIRKKHGDRNWSLVLPEFGTTVRVVDAATSAPLIELQWVNGVFRIK